MNYTDSRTHVYIIIYILYYTCNRPGAKRKGVYRGHFTYYYITYFHYLKQPTPDTVTRTTTTTDMTTTTTPTIAAAAAAAVTIEKKRIVIELSLLNDNM